MPGRDVRSDHCDRNNSLRMSKTLAKRIVQYTNLLKLPPIAMLIEGLPYYAGKVYQRIYELWCVRHHRCETSFEASTRPPRFMPPQWGLDGCFRQKVSEIVTGSRVMMTADCDLPYQYHPSSSYVTQALLESQANGKKL
jgi:hypothetical protein